MKRRVRNPKRLLLAGIAMLSLNLPLVLAQNLADAARALQSWNQWRSTLQYPGVPSGLSAEAYRQRAHQLAAQARATYPTAFYDQSVWQAAVRHAEMAYRVEPQNPLNQRLFAELLTATKFWYPAYLLWADLDTKQSLQESDRELAALSAAKMGYYRHRMGMEFQAMAYLEISLRFAYDPGVAALLEAVRGDDAAGVGQ